MLKNFMITFQVEGSDGSIMPNGISAAYVTCITRSSSIETAAERIIGKLKQDGLSINEMMDDIYTLDSTWSTLVNDNWSEYANHLINDVEFEEIMNSSGVVYSPFAGYS